MKRIQQGFTLIELMIVVAIIGILAAIAIPAYQDFIIRSKVTEAVTAMGACKTSVTDYYASRGTMPGDVTQAGCSTTATKYLANMNVTASGIVATLSSDPSLKAATGCLLTLTPVTGGPGADITEWTGNSSCAKYVPANFR